MNPVFRHITVPVDGSATADRGVAFAVELARDGGTITFCSVVDPSLVFVPAGGVIGAAGADPEPLLSVLDEDAALFCRSARDQAVTAGVTADIRVLHGPCTDAIEALVRENDTQAIVLGTHGRTGIGRAVLGSVAEALIRRSDVPVVAVHEGDAIRTGPLAVAFDESPAAHAALEMATGIACVRGMPIVLVHACERPDADLGRMNALLNGAAKRARARGATVNIVIRAGAAERTIVEVAEQLECCMIAIGTHGRAFLQRLVLGSVAAHVVEHASVPVVTVRRAAAA